MIASTSQAITVTITCPVCLLPVRLSVGTLVLDEDGDLAFDASEVRRAATLHLRHGCKGPG